MLRTAVYLLAGCAPVDSRSSVRRALFAALVGLIRAVTEILHTVALPCDGKR